MQIAPRDLLVRFAMPVQKGFPYLKAFNHQLSLMEESGILNRLRNKWLHARELTVEHICQDTIESNEETSGYEIVKWRNVIDLFWLLLVGMAGCVVVAFLEQMASLVSSSL